MNLHCGKFNRVPKCQFREGYSPQKAPERPACNCCSGIFNYPKHSTMELFLTNKVVVKWFSVATTKDIEGFNKPVLSKEPDSIIINVGTNKRKGCINNNLAVFKIKVTRTRINQLSYFGILTRAADKERKGLTNSNKILEKTNGTLLNIIMLSRLI